MSNTQADTANSPSESEKNRPEDSGRFAVKLSNLAEPGWLTHP